MKVVIDSEACQGHQICAIKAPNLFDSDDEGYGIVVGDGTVPAGDEDLARSAAASCPESAISIVDE